MPQGRGAVIALPLILVMISGIGTKCLTFDADYHMFFDGDNERSRSFQCVLPCHLVAR